MLVGQPAGRSGGRRAALGAEGPTVGQRAGRFAAGSAPGRVGLQIAGLDPTRAQRQGPVAVRYLEGGCGLAGPPTALDLPRGGTGLGDGLADSPSAETIRHGHEGIGRGLVIGEAAEAERDIGADTLGLPSFELGPPRRGAEIASVAHLGLGRRRAAHRHPPRLDDRLPAGAATEVRRQGPIEGVSPDRSVRRLRPQPLESTDDARGAEAALAGPGGQERLGPTLAVLGVEAGDGGDHPPGHASRRGHARHPRGTVDQTPCSTHTGPAGCTRP